MEVHGGDTDGRTTELSLDDVEGDAFTGHPDRVGVAELLESRASSDAGLLCEVPGAARQPGSCAPQLDLSAGIRVALGTPTPGAPAQELRTLHCVVHGLGNLTASHTLRPEWKRATNPLHLLLEAPIDPPSS